MKEYTLLNNTHRKLTALCAGITTFILLVMSLSYLYVSENSLKDNHFFYFKSSMNTFLSNLSQQDIITHEWLVTAEITGNFFIQIKDNGKDFLYNNRRNDVFKTTLIEYAKSFYEQSFLIESSNSPGAMEHTEFSFIYEDTPYYGSIGTLYKENGTLDITLVSPATLLKRQIFRQRMIFLGINLASAILLTAFAYYFTGKLLKPIAKSHEDQIHFIAAASHELRTPLAVILSCTEACNKANYMEKDKFLHTIHSEGIRMSRLIHDMLFLSKTDSHAFPMVKKECDPDALLLTSYESFEMLAKEKGITLSVSLPDESAISCLWDPERILQVLSILLQNALSYTPEGGHVTLSMKIQPNHILYTVSDTGIGIANEYKKDIFKRFYRIDNSRNEKEHFGLGLSIAFEIVSAHHGTIQVCDTSGGGSTFIVRLPVT